MSRIIERRDRLESCSQFAISPEHTHVDKALFTLMESGLYQVFGWEIVLLPNDLVFYGDISGYPYHVAKVDTEGLLLSKFHKRVEVYQHTIWEDPPIPSDDYGYESAIVLRLIARG